MELAVAPDGRIFFIELNGEFRVLDPQKGEPTLIRKFEVARRGEVGLIGLALDPNFENNNWVYLQYSPIGLTSQRTSRFTLQGNQDRRGKREKSSSNSTNPLEPGPTMLVHWNLDPRAAFIFPPAMIPAQVEIPRDMPRSMIAPASSV